MPVFTDATSQEIEAAVTSAWNAFLVYKKKNLKERADFLRSIAKGLEKSSEAIIECAMEETNLEKERLSIEFKRTLFQLTSYAQACEEGAWLDTRINTTSSLASGTSKVDLRKMLVPLGPVVVFGSSNFPFAYSTAGGDTTCALAAGCPVIIKVHPAHADTSQMVYEVIRDVAKQCGLPEGVFHHVHGASFDVGKALVQHPLVRAVGFTGSYEGGKALFDWGNTRPVPIPVFSEMGSINPVFLMPKKLEQNAEEIAKMYVDSITQSVGQLCTNPGIIIGIKGAALSQFMEFLGNGIKEIKPAKMLHAGIAKAFHKKREEALQQSGVTIAAQSSFSANANEGLPTITTTTAANFLKNPVLHKEIFGPYSIVIQCENENEMLSVAQHMEGQLATTLIATDEEVKNNTELVDTLKEICGRFILNGVPTGVEVALAMHHGGPFPATSDSRFTAVGADGIKRFARPVSFQNWSTDLLPVELRNENPLKIWRTVNGQLTNGSIT
jgi:2,5-dioxopentanoate dehydrogenase